MKCKGLFIHSKPKTQHLEGQFDKTPLNRTGVFTQSNPSKQHLHELSETATIGKEDLDSTNAGNSAYKRQVYKSVQQSSKGMREIRWKLKDGSEKLSSQDRESFREWVEAEDIVCCKRKSGSTLSRTKGIN